MGEFTLYTAFGGVFAPQDRALESLANVRMAVSRLSTSFPAEYGRTLYVDACVGLRARARAQPYDPKLGRRPRPEEYDFRARVRGGAWRAKPVDRSSKINPKDPKTW